MLTEETTKILLQGYFERNNLVFCSVIPIYEEGRRIMLIEFGCDKGFYHMKLFDDDLSLFCKSNKGDNWIQIEKY